MKERAHRPADPWAGADPWPGRLSMRARLARYWARWDVHLGLLALAAIWFAAAVWFWPLIVAAMGG